MQSLERLHSPYVMSQEGWNSCVAMTYLCRCCAGALASNLDACRLTNCYCQPAQHLQHTTVRIANYGSYQLSTACIFLINLNTAAVMFFVAPTLALQGKERLDLAQRLLHLCAFRRVKQVSFTLISNAIKAVTKRYLKIAKCVATGKGPSKPTDYHT